MNLAAWGLDGCGWCAELGGKAMSFQVHHPSIRRQCVHDDPGRQDSLTFNFQPPIRSPFPPRTSSYPEERVYAGANDHVISLAE